MKYSALNILIILLVCLTVVLSAADIKTDKTSSVMITQEDPIADYDWDWHMIGNLWNRVTNFSYMGDDAYTDRTPSCDYPGGTGNSYLYRGTLWLSAFVNGQFHSTQGGYDNEFSPLTPVTMFTGDEAIKAEQETHAEYYDVRVPSASDHFPLGLKIIERTYAWSAEFASDFIIYEYDIVNVGIDTNGDGIPDTDRDLDDFYFTIRFDADVSKLPHWGAEYRFSNQDDHVVSNGVNWDWIETFPQMRGRDHGLTMDDIDSSLIIMFDGDNPEHDAFNGHPCDFGNPAEDGTLQSPGFIGVRVLKTEPELKPHSFHACHIYNDPGTDKETWDRMLSDPTFEELIIYPRTGLPYPMDYRGILTFGPLEKFLAGDTLKVTTALGVGSDPDSGGVYSLIKLVNIMGYAKYIVDHDFDLSGIDVLNTKPGNFNLIFPAYQMPVSKKTPLLKWQRAYDPDPHDTVTYSLFCGVNQEDLPLIYKGTKTYYEFEEPLQDKTIYHWKVIAEDKAGAIRENMDDCFSFYVNTENNAPSVPELISPDSVVVRHTEVTFLWEPSEDPDYWDYVRYTLYWWELEDIPDSVNLDTNYTKITLEDNSQYFWKVKVYDTQKACSESKTSVFWTDSIPEPPDDFTSIFPENHATLQSNDVTFIWNQTTDPDPLDEVYYKVVVASDWDDQETYIYSELTTDTTLAMTLTINSQYYWRVEAWDSDSLMTASNSGHVYSFVLGSVSVLGAGIPSEFQLAQNYPNPFNPTTVIEYSLPEMSDVTLLIYDLKGNVIQQWNYSNQSVGFYKVTWDGSNTYGNKVSTGIYFYRIIAGDFTQTKKMVFMK